MVRAILCVLLAAFTFPASADGALVRQLREGGYVLYMRHASTDFSQNDAKMTSYEDCASQRNLLDKGRAEARSVAGHIRRLGIPVGSVLASPFCRTMETARLAFGKAEATQDARGGPARPDDPGRYAPLKTMLSSPVEAGKNRVIVSHGNPFHAVAGPPYLAEGEIAIVRPDGKGFTVLARIRVEDWPGLK
jgi:phosphohistidine phosphatase SixA